MKQRENKEKDTKQIKIKTSNRKQRMKTNERMETRVTYNCAHLRITNQKRLTVEDGNKTKWRTLHTTHSTYIAVVERFEMGCQKKINAFIL